MAYHDAGPPVMKGAGYGGTSGDTDPFSTLTSQNDPFAAVGQPKKSTGVSALKWDPRTGKVQAGTDIGEEPLPGCRMTDAECQRHGLPKGSLWLDEEAAKSTPHPLFDPSRTSIAWDELPTGLSEAIASTGNLVARSQQNPYGNIPESESQPRTLNVGNDEYVPGRVRVVCASTQI